MAEILDTKALFAKVETDLKAQLDILLAHVEGLEKTFSKDAKVLSSRIEVLEKEFLRETSAKEDVVVLEAKVLAVLKSMGADVRKFFIKNKGQKCQEPLQPT